MQPWCSCWCRCVWNRNQRTRTCVHHFSCRLPDAKAEYEPFLCVYACFFVLLLLFCCCCCCCCWFVVVLVVCFVLFVLVCCCHNGITFRTRCIHANWYLCPIHTVMHAHAALPRVHCLPVGREASGARWPEPRTSCCLWLLWMREDRIRTVSKWLQN